jgi:hypothetical protein
MRENPSVPAKTVLKHIQTSRQRVERIAKDAEYFRQGLRRLQVDAISLRNVLEDKPEELAKLESGLMAIQYSAGGVLSSLDQAIRFELSFQAEAERWLHGKIPRLEKNRPHLAYEQANGGRPEKNGTAAPPKGAYDYVKAGGEEVETKKPDPAVAVGFYLEIDPVTKQEKRVYVNAYDQVVEPPKGQDIAVSISGVGETETKLPPAVPTLVEEGALPSLVDDGAPQAEEPTS